VTAVPTPEDLGTWDVVVAGASFAGLAVARELSCRALLVDPVEVGEGQTSACAAPLGVLAHLGALASVQQEHRELVLHTVAGDVRWPLPETFATFDYRACCREAARGVRAEVLRASVRARAGTVVMTSLGRVRARVLVDCTGWRAALAGGGPGTRYFGVEVESPVLFPEGLHFYFWPEVIGNGYGWAFPAGPVTRVGVLSYDGRSRLRPALDTLLERLGLPGGRRHGGYLGVGLGPAVVEGVFRVGDAGGHCLPLSGEGIRTAVRAGSVCGRLVDRAIRREISLDRARADYARYVAAQRRRIAWLEGATQVLSECPPRLLGPLARGARALGLLRVFWRYYLGTFPDEERDRRTSALRPLSPDGALWARDR
jgi:flavin-dependent dehydrogenase